MPKGVGRPQNRKTKQAVAGSKNRMNAFSSAIRGGASPSTATRKILKSPGAAADIQTRAESRTREFDRSSLSGIGRTFLTQPSPSTQRERIKRKKN